MRKVKNEYEKCADAYRNNMKEINEQKSAEVFTTTTTTVTPPSIVQISLMKRQQSSQSIYVSHETTTSTAVNAVKNTSTEAIDQGEVQIKRVCWSVLAA